MCTAPTQAAECQLVIRCLPSGVPDVMFENPESVDALDFKVSQHPNEDLCLN